MWIKSALIVLAFLFFSCNKKLSDEQEQYVKNIENERKTKNDFMKNSPDSPFNFKGKVHFEPLKYFDVNFDLIFKSKLYEFDIKDTISIFGTKGDERKVLKFGYVQFHYNNVMYKMNVYSGRTKNGVSYFSLWFTDKTTNESTYGVGRYLDFELNENKNFEYTIDFNLAYNPYCSYSPNYSCAIPAKDDYLDIAITAGEKKFHN